MTASTIDGVTRWRLCVRVGVVAALLVMRSAGPAYAQQPINDQSLSAIRTWAAAVAQHTPGANDSAVATVAAFSYEMRERLNSGMGLFLKGLLGLTYATGDNTAAREIAKLGPASGAMGAAAFLKRAAVMHADAVEYFGHSAAPSTTASGASTRTRPTRAGNGVPLSSADAVPLLLMEDRLPLGLDGQVIGETIVSWHWPFARGLLDLLNRDNASRVDVILAGGARVRPAADPFVAVWYHATAAAMFSRSAYGELTPHLEHASAILPNSALVRFDRGCYAESLGLPLMQSMISTYNRRFNASLGSGPMWRPPVAQVDAGIPAAGKANSDAERFYRDALSIDPSLVEVRVRLARLLESRGRSEQAIGELATAIADAPTGAVAFYANLFAGRSAQSLGHLDQAATHYRAASMQFPQAQSALVAMSQVALLRSDVDASLSAIGRLGSDVPDFSADPWWVYHRCAGRDAGTLLQELWSSFDMAALRGGY